MKCTLPWLCTPPRTAAVLGGVHRTTVLDLLGQEAARAATAAVLLVRQAAVGLHLPVQRAATAASPLVLVRQAAVELELLAQQAAVGLHLPVQRAATAAGPLVLVRQAAIELELLVQQAAAGHPAGLAHTSPEHPRTFDGRPADELRVRGGPNTVHLHTESTDQVLEQA